MKNVAFSAFASYTQRWALLKDIPDAKEVSADFGDFLIETDKIEQELDHHLNDIVAFLSSTPKISSQILLIHKILVRDPTLILPIFNNQSSNIFLRL